MLDDLDDAIKAHKPHPKSLKDEESTEAYNEEDARRTFGDEYIDGIKDYQYEFRGDWWQLSFLVKNLEEDKQNPEIKDEHRLKAWNKWRRYHWSPAYEYIHLEHAYLVRAHLEHAYLVRAHLEHAYLVRAHLEHAQLFDAHLEHARLVDAHLEHAYLKDAHLEHAYLEGANLEQAHLQGAHLEHVRLPIAQLEHAYIFRTHLEHADLEGANLEHANLSFAHLEHANLIFAHLEHANLEDAHLEHADLRRAHLEHAILQEANLNGADVREATGLVCDGNRVEGIRIEGDAPDPWSVLRRKYTGPWFFVHLLLLAIFFAPYVGHALYLTAKSQFQEWSMEQYNALGDRVDDIPGLSKSHAELQQRFFEKHEHRRAVWVLLGLHRGILPVMLAAIVVLYNAMRGFLTLRVSILRDAEERSNITPLWSEYKWLHKTHLVARVLLWIAVLAVVYNTVVWAVDTWIWVPKSA